MDPDDPAPRVPTPQAGPANEPPGMNLTNLRLVAGLTGVERTLFDLGVFPAGGVGYRDGSLPGDDGDPVTAAVETVRARVMSSNVDVVMGVVRPQHSATGGLEIVVDSRVAERPTLEQLLADDDAVRLAVETLRGHGTVITMTPRPAPTIRRIGQIYERLQGIRDAQGRIVSVVFSPDLAAGVVRVATAAEHVVTVRRAVTAFGSDVVVEGGDEFIVVE